MTVTSQTSRNDYNGNGVTTLFPVAFRFLQSSHLRVIRTVVATGDATTLTLNAGGANGYTVSGAGQPSGGAVGLNVAPAVGERLSILRNVPVTQEVDYLANDPFPAETHEQALDKLTMIAQQLAESQARSLTLPPQSSGVSTELSELAPLDVLRLNAAGDKFEGFQLTPYGGVSGADMIGFLQAGSGSVLRTVQSKLRDTVHVIDKGAVGNGVVNDTTAFSNAAATGRIVHVSGGSYNLSTPPSVGSSTLLIDRLLGLVGGGAANLEAINAIIMDAGYFCGMPIVSDQRGRKYEIMAGVIRQSSIDPTNWFFIDDVGHRPVGFNTIVNSGGSGNLIAAGTDLPIFFRKTYGKVVSFLAVPDETLARNYGLSIGASVATNSVTLRASITRTISGNVRWTGSAWAVSAPEIGFSAISATAISGSTLRVTHDWVFDNSVDLTAWTQTGAIDPYYPVFRECNTVQFDVSFRSPTTGAFVTTLPAPSGDTRCSFSFKRGGNTPVRLDGVGVSAEVDFRNGGNIWLFGIMEVA